MREFIRSILFCTAIIILASNAKAENSPEKMRLPEARSVQNVEVFISPHGLKTVIPLTEEMMRSHHCSFESDQPEKIADLFSRISKYLEKSDHVGEIKLRHIIYFNLKNGEKSKILMSDDANLDYSVLANYVQGTDDGKDQIKFRKGFLRSLRQWASEGVGVKNYSQYCLESPRSTQ